MFAIWHWFSSWPDGGGEFRNWKRKAVVSEGLDQKSVSMDAPVKIANFMGWAGGGWQAGPVPEKNGICS